MKRTVNLELTPEQISVILRALAVCSADAEDSRDTCNGETIREYYDRKRREYDDAYNAVHDVTEDARFREVDKALTISRNCLECPEPAYTVCADMRK